MQEHNVIVHSRTSQLHAFLKRLLPAVLLFALLPLALSAQVKTPSFQANGTIKGTIVDSASKLPLSGVTINLIDENNIDVKSVASGSDGLFEISGIAYRRYHLSFSHIGYKEKILALPAFTSAIIFVGNVSIASATSELKEVVVTSTKRLVEHQVNKIVYNVDADPDSKTANTFDILRKVPMVSTDGEGNLQLKGSGVFKVLINGRSSSLFVRNVSEIFKTMPASFVKRIEVIPNPPARYDAEGISGIINIVTNKKRINGYNGSIGLSVDNPQGHSISGFTTAKAGKFGISVNAGNTGSKSPPSYSDFSRKDKVLLLDLKQHGESNTLNRSKYISSEFSFEADSLNLLTASYNRTQGTGISDFSQLVELRDKSSVLQQLYKNSNNSTSTWIGHDLGIDLQHTFKRNKDQLLTLSYKISSNGSNGVAGILLQPLLNYTGQQSTSANSNSFKEQTMQVDYVQPIKDHLIEAGVKTINRNNNSTYGYNIYDSVTNVFVPEPKLSNNFDYRQQINTGYISITLKNNSWLLSAGGRLEETKIDANFKSSGTTASQKYINAFPSATITRKLNTTGSLSFTFSQRIERPSLYYLDPFIDLTDPRNIYFGNPNLKPAINNTFNLSYFTFIKNTSLTVALFHQYTNNSIERFTSLGIDTIARTTYGNIGRNQSFGFSISTNATLFERLSIAFNSNGSYIKYTSTINDQLRNSEGFTSDIFGYASYRFNKGWRVNGSINYNSPGILLQGTQAGFITNSFAITKEFLKNKKANASLTVANPFQKNRNLFTEMQDPAFYQLQQSSFNIRRFTLALHFRFGKLKEDISRKKRGIKNDDLKTGN